MINKIKDKLFKKKIPEPTPIPEEQPGTITQQPIDDSGGLFKPPSKRKLIARIVVWTLVVITTLLVGVTASGWVWYRTQISPVSDNKQVLIPVTIIVGSSPGEIGQLLVDRSLIRNKMAFDTYTYLSNARSSLQAGSYRLSPGESTQEIVGHLLNGKTAQFQITFYPGATLRDSSDKPENKKSDVVTVLRQAHFTQDEIDEALAAKYDSPLFDKKPSFSDLEGYIYGQTYNFDEGASVKDILQRTFDQFYSDLTGNNLIAGFKKNGLNLREAIILASIVQREASDPAEQKQVAQVFYLRLKKGMQLGSDVTYQYIADKLGVARDTNLDNPYNTRIYTGLPPGPIASPGLSALKAVANPASGDYLYFLAGDDGKMYYAHSDAEHEANKVNHCKINCSQL